MVNIKIIYDKKTHNLELKDGSTVEEAIKLIKINPQIVIARRGDEIIPDTEKLKNNDRIELIRVVSGG